MWWIAFIPQHGLSCIRRLSWRSLLGRQHRRDRGRVRRASFPYLYLILSLFYLILSCYVLYCLVFYLSIWSWSSSSPLLIILSDFWLKWSLMQAVVTVIGCRYTQACITYRSHTPLTHTIRRLSKANNRKSGVNMEEQKWIWLKMKLSFTAVLQPYDTHVRAWLYL